MAQVLLQARAHEQRSRYQDAYPANRPPDTLHEAVSPDGALARKNNVWGLLLLGLFLLLFAGTFVVGLVYLWLD